MITRKTLKECMGMYSYNILRCIAADKGIKVGGELSKKELCERIAERMMETETLSLYFSCLFDDEIERLEQAIRWFKTEIQSNVPNEDCKSIVQKEGRGEGVYNEEREGDCIIPELLCQAEYAFRLDEDSEMFWLPWDVAEAYQNMSFQQFHEKRKKQNYFLSCLIAVGTFYGSVPLSVIAPVMRMEVEEVVAAVAGLPVELKHYLVVGDMICHRDLYIEEAGIVPGQIEGEYYIPEPEELEDLARFGYLPKRMEMRALVGYLVNERNMKAESAEYAAMWVQKIVAADGCLEDVYEYLEDFGVLNSKEVPEELESIMKAFRMNTRMLVNRGFTELELSKSEPETVFRVCEPLINRIGE